VAYDFDLPCARNSKTEVLFALNSMLIQRANQNQTTALIVDEAQNLSWDVLEEIRLLGNLETRRGKLMQIVLSGQPELEEKLRAPDVRQLRQRIALWARTHAITAEQTANYIAQRLLIAGTSEPIFSDDAIAAIHRASRGIPRIINLICEHALILAYVEQLRQVPEPLIHAVARDLDLDTQPFMVSTANTSSYAASSTLPSQKHPGREER